MFASAYIYKAEILFEIAQDLNLTLDVAKLHDDLIRLPEHDHLFTHQPNPEPDDPNPD